MADRLMRSGASLLMFVAVALSSPALAQGSIADPTRPPIGAVGAGEDTGEGSGPFLQSVMIPKKGKPMALIGGQQVVLGAMYGDRRLISLNEREAVLEGPDGVERLFLTPGIEKINTVVKTPAAKNGQSKGKP